MTVFCVCVVASFHDFLGFAPCGALTFFFVCVVASFTIFGGSLPVAPSSFFLCVWLLLFTIFWGSSPVAGITERHFHSFFENQIWIVCFYHRLFKNVMSQDRFSLVTQ